jgi:WD40 repeat protein
MTGPPDADPMTLNAEVDLRNWLSIDSQGRWLATANGGHAMVWPLEYKQSYILRVRPTGEVAFTSDCKHLIYPSGDTTILVWPLSLQYGETKRVLLEDKSAKLRLLSMDSTRNLILSASIYDRRVFLLSASGGTPRRLPVPPAGGELVAVELSPDGRFAAAAQMPKLGQRGGTEMVRIWNLESQEHSDLNRVMENEDCGWSPHDKGLVTDLGFTPDADLITAGRTAIRRWDLTKKTSRMIRPCKKDLDTTFSMSADGDRLLVLDRTPTRLIPSSLSVYSVNENSWREIVSHGNRISAIALNRAGTIAVTGDEDGVVRAGPITGEEPHVLFGHEMKVWSVAVSADDRWIATASDDGTLRLWPMPEGQPFHTLPHSELLQRLRAMTNLRVIADHKASTGYRLEAGTFPGWEKLPEW